MPDTSMPHTIEAEIFSTGTWNGETFTRQDLEEIAGNFTVLRELLKPPLKFGHDPEQTLIGQADGDPALGWVEALRVEDDRMIATFAGVPEVVWDAIREGRYRHVSAELYFGVRHEGKLLGKALKAVALLGADLPAVTNLEELGAYLDGVPGFDPPAPEIRHFTLAVREGRLAAPATGEGPVTGDGTGGDLELELAELRAYKARQQTRETEQAERNRQSAFRSAHQGVETFCQEAVTEGKMPPHPRQRLLREIDAQLLCFSERSPLSVSLDWVKAFVAASPQALPFGELALAGERDTEEQGGDDPSRTLGRLASAKMIEMNISYGRAADYVLDTNPGLARSYRDYILNANTGG